MNGDLNPDDDGKGYDNNEPYSNNIVVKEPKKEMEVLFMDGWRCIELPEVDQ